MPLSDFDWEFEWEEGIIDIEDVGRCFVGYVKPPNEKQWYRLAISLKELETWAKQKVTQNEQTKH